MRRLRDDSGVVAVIAAIVLPVLVIAAGMVIDLSSVAITANRAQTAADAAALAVAQECAVGDCTEPHSTATELAEANLPGTDFVEVDPIDRKTVTVHVAATHRFFFAVVLGEEYGSRTVEASAEAVWTPTGVRLVS